MIETANQVYDFAYRMIEQSRAAGHDDVAQSLDDAMHLGSSGLEILGAIGNVLSGYKNTIEKFASESEIEEVVRFVNRAFGRD